MTDRDRLDVEAMKASWLEAVANNHGLDFARHFVPDILAELEAARKSQSELEGRIKAMVLKECNEGCHEPGYGHTVFCSEMRDLARGEASKNEEAAS